MLAWILILIFLEVLIIWAAIFSPENIFFWAFLFFGTGGTIAAVLGLEGLAGVVIFLSCIFAFFAFLLPLKGWSRDE
ncbi:MAG: hypothetical protein M1438_13100 [Deltaproteobacteria bacterium]|nr:hypothetical protein [Deltaproteobacteria bacterium]